LSSGPDCRGCRSGDPGDECAAQQRRAGIDGAVACRFDRCASAQWREGTMLIRAPKDFWSGVMFCGFALVAVVAARGYSLGTAGKMGPGYFPLLLGLVLGGPGVVLIVRAVVLDGEPLPRFQLLPLLIIALAVCLFGALIEPLGLVVALAVLVVLSAWAGPQFRWLETAGLAAVLIAFSIGVFVYALG